MPTIPGMKISLKAFVRLCREYRGNGKEKYSPEGQEQGN